jgi:Aldose 1-epimerase
MKVKNIGSEAFPFQILFHTYVRVPEISTVKVLGLNGSTFKDAVIGSDITVHSVTFSQDVDRIYAGINTDHVTVEDTMVLYKQNLKDVVVWNPWIEKAKGMKVELVYVRTLMTRSISRWYVLSMAMLMDLTCFYPAAMQTFHKRLFAGSYRGETSTVYIKEIFWIIGCLLQGSIQMKANSVSHTPLLHLVNPH